MIVEAGSAFADIPRENPCTRRKSHGLAYDVDYFPGYASSAEGAEISRAVLLRPVYYGKFRILRILVKPYKRIALVSLRRML